MMKKFVKSNQRRGVLAIITLAIASLVSSGLHYQKLKNRFVINTTPSMPLGLYEITNKPIVKGAIVGACVPESFATLAKKRNYVGAGSCGNGLRPVMKHLVALSGDSVEVGLRGVSVNGKEIQNTRVLLQDAAGKELPNQIGKHFVGKNQYWLISNRNVGCFDSRYFGPVSEILGVVEPLITRNTLCQTFPFSHLIRCSGDSQ